VDVCFPPKALRVEVSGNLAENGEGFRGAPNEGRGLEAVSKEVVGTRTAPRRSLFACDIPHRLLLRASLAKPTFAALRF
jgi:hypothetical protein